MASGLPVLAYPNGSVPEVIDYGVTGYYAGSVETLVPLVPKALALDRVRCASTRAGDSAISAWWTSTRPCFATCWVPRGLGPGPLTSGELRIAPMRASVIVTSYNYGRFLRTAIDSALAQTYPAEVIVVDDGSTDESRQIIESYGSRIVSLFKSNGGRARR